MKYTIQGTLLQTVEIELQPGETLYSQTAMMAWMTGGIKMDTHTGGGLLAGLKRSLSGGSFFVTDFTAQQPAQIAFAPKFPGAILPVKVLPENPQMVAVDWAAF